MDLVEDERIEYFNLGRTVRRIVARPLTPDEEQLVARLGDNPKEQKQDG